MMPVFIRYATLFLGLTLVSCTSTPQPPTPPTTAQSTPLSTPPSGPKPTLPAPTPQPSIAPTTSDAMSATSATTIPVAVYHMDSNCNQLVKKTEQLPKEKTMDRAIGSVLNRANTADFTITDYRVTSQGEVATIVLRLPPGGARSFKSMSSCEQMSFFGAMRETVMQRKEWGIKDVTFTDGKQEIQF